MPSRKFEFVPVPLASNVEPKSKKQKAPLPMEDPDQYLILSASCIKSDESEFHTAEPLRGKVLHMETYNKILIS